MSTETIQNLIEYYISLHSRKSPKAFEELVLRGSSEIPSLIAILEGPAIDDYHLTESQYVSLKILAALGEIAIDPLLKLLAQKNQRPHFDGICDALITIGPSCINKVEGLLYDERFALVRVLAGIANYEAVKILGQIVVCNEHFDDYARIKAAETLAEMDNDEALQSISWLISDPLPGIRIHAARALGKLRDRFYVDQLISGLLNQEGKSREMEEIRINSAWALGQIGDHKAVPALLEFIANRSQYLSPWEGEFALILRTSALESVIKALGKLEDRSAVEPLIDLLKDKNLKSELCIAACQTLGTLKDQSALPILTELAVDGVEDVRGAAVEAIGDIGDPWCIDSIYDALEDPSAFVRKEAVIALGKLGTGDDVDVLIDILKDGDEDDYIKKEVCSAILKIGTDSIAAITEDYIKNYEYNNGSSYMNSKYWIPILKKIGDDSLKPFLKLLEKPRDHSSEWLMAVSALGALGFPAAVNPLCKCFFNEQEDLSIKEEIRLAIRSIVYESLQALYCSKKEVVDGVVDELLKVFESHH